MMVAIGAVDAVRTARIVMEEAGRSGVTDMGHVIELVGPAGVEEFLAEWARLGGFPPLKEMEEEVSR